MRLAPQKVCEINNPRKLAEVLKKLEQVQTDFNNSQSGGKKVRDVVSLVAVAT